MHQRDDIAPGRGGVLVTPSRRQIFDLLAGSALPLGVSDLATATGMHPNTVRLHLARLLEAGLVAQETVRPGHRGRPGYRYHVIASDPVEEAAAYRRLSAWLVEAIPDAGAAREAGRRAGTRDAQETASSSHDALFEVFAAQEFAPEWQRIDGEAGDSGAVEVLVLHRCPFADAVRVDPAIVCSLHLGIAEGVASRLGGLTIEALDPANDPDAAGCRLHVRQRGAGVDGAHEPRAG